MEELLETLELIGTYKVMLPFRLRGWVNELGLYVQLRQAGPLARLQAGGSMRSYIDAWRTVNGQWEVKKFDRKTWDTRFARLVQPTLKIASFLVNRVQSDGTLDGEAAVSLSEALEHYRLTGEWQPSL